MVNETSSATVTRLSSVVNISRPNLNQEADRLPEAADQSLPVEGKNQPQVVQRSTDIREAVSEINDFVQSVQRDLSFNMDEASGHTVIKVIDRDSGDLIRQIPSEEVLAIADHLRSVRENSVNPSEVPTGLIFSEST
jgi:flagellar protein FlaG